MGSARLEGKVLKKIYQNKNILEFIISNLKLLNEKIIIATTNKESDKAIVKLAVNKGIDYYCGNENNVLKRYIYCAEEFSISKIIRICADNVFIQNEFISKFINKMNSKFDYISHKINHKNVILTHWGLFAEYVTLDALKKVNRLTTSNHYCEHVTSYIYSNPDLFKIKYLKVPKELHREDIRLTIDTIEDFKICKRIIEFLIRNGLEWHYKNIIRYIDNNPSLLKSMSKNIKNNKKSMI